jgi:hypothetical protein
MLKTLKRSLGWRLLLEGNRLLGRSWAPSPRRAIFIEPTSTCNLGCRFCTYEMELRPRQTMSLDMFESFAIQAERMGFSQVYLTPQTGDVFMDKGLEGKLAVLESLPGIRGVGFFTNFVAASPERLADLVRFTKVSGIQISLYGADEAGFVAITRRTPGQFQKLLANLDALIALLPHWPGLQPGLTLRVGDSFRLEGWSGPLAERVLHLRDRLGVTLNTDTDYDDWCGRISQSDVEGLDITIRPGRPVYNRGACIKALGQPLIRVNGQVDACASRDTMDMLVLGDLTTESLDAILSWDNPRYRALLDGMERGNFPKVCHDCAVYRSVYDPRWAEGRGDVISLGQALDLMGRGDAAPASETAAPGQAGKAPP